MLTSRLVRRWCDSLKVGSARWGWLLPATVALGVLVWSAAQFVPAYGGYTWESLAWILRGVFLRAWFPTAALAAWVLGALSVAERRHALAQAGRWLTTDQGATWSRRLGALLIAGAAVLVARTLNPTYSPTDVLAYALVAVWLTHRCHREGQLRAVLFDLSRLAVVFVTVSFIFTVVKSQLFVLRSPVDAQLVAFEATLFGAPPHRWFASLAATRPWIARVFDETYFRLFEHMTVGSMFLLGAGRSKERARLWIALAICYILGGFSYYALPGLGPAYHEAELYGFLRASAPVTAHTQQALWSASNSMKTAVNVVLPTYGFIACFPSLHMAHEFVLLYYARFSRPFFVLSGLFVGLTWIATLGLGWHYSIDVVGGLALAAVSVWVADRWGRQLFPTAIQDDHAFELGDLTPQAWSALAILLTVLLAHGATLWGGMTLDDAHLVVSRNLRDLGDLWGAITPGLYQASGEPRLVHAFRPLAGAANWLLWQIARDMPSTHHLLDLLLGAGALIALSRFLRALGASRGVAVGLALAVAVHPLSSELLAYSSARDLVLGWLLWLSLSARVVTHRDKPWPGVALATLLASLAHEAFLLLGLVAILLLPNRDRRGHVGKVVGGHALGVGLALGVRVLGSPDAWAIANPLAFLPGVLVRSVRIVLAPVNVSPLVTTPEGASLWGGAVVVTAIAAIVLLARGSVRHPWMQRLALGCALVLGTCLAQGYGAGLTAIIADRGSWGVLIGLVVAAAPAVEHVTAWAASHLDRLRRRVLLGGLVGLAAVALPLTWSNDLTYKNNQALARLLLTTNPGDPAVQARAGLMLAYTDEVQAAVAYCTAASGNQHVAYDADLCLAVLATRIGRDGEALARVTTYLGRHPERLQARNLLWHLLEKHGRRADMEAWVVRLEDRIGSTPDLEAVRVMLDRRQATNPYLQPPE